MVDLLRFRSLAASVSAVALFMLVVTAASSVHARSTVDFIELTKVVFVLEEIDFEPVGSGDDDDDTDDIELPGPIVIPIPLNGDALLIDTGSIEPGFYEEVELELRPMNNPDRPGIINLSDVSNETLQGRSVYIEGIVHDNGTTESFVFEDTQNIDVENEEIFEVDANHVATLILQIPTDRFFEVDGEVLDPRDPTCFAPIRLNIRSLLLDADDSPRCEGNPNEVRLEGEITEVDRGTTTGELASLEVLGLTVVRTAATQIEDEDNVTIDDSAFVVGERVEIRGVLQADGSIVAEEIALDDDDENEVKIEAPIEALVTDGPNVIGVDVLGVTVAIDSNTEVEDNEGDPIDAEELSVGDFVEIKARDEGALGLVARRIEVEDDDDDEDLKVEGILESADVGASETLAVVSGVAVIFDDDTNFEDGAENLEIGDRVEVKGHFDGSGNFIADEVELEDDGDEVEKIEGVIQEIALVDDEVVTFTIAGVDILVDNDTRVLPRGPSFPTPEDLEEGRRVRVEGQFDIPAEQMLALRIKDRDRPCRRPFDRDDDDDDDDEDDDGDDEDDDGDDDDDSDDARAPGSAFIKTSDSKTLGTVSETDGFVSFGFQGTGAINDGPNAARDWQRYE